MFKNNSEEIVTSINRNLFYDEFTFKKTEFSTAAGNIELADNILWIDEILFVNQIKERNSSNAKGSVDNWFINKVLKKAKNQIKNTINYLKTYDSIPITNGKGQVVDISKIVFSEINNVIIYKVEERLSEANRNAKFYESREVGYIHIFHFEDYYWVCRYLLTPTELDEYFKFRQRIYIRHKDKIQVLTEQYMLSHFLMTDDESEIRPEFIESLNKIKNDLADYDISGLIESFQAAIRDGSQRFPTDYHLIIKELAKLKRYELLEFKKRFMLIIEDINLKRETMPRRFFSTRSNCGFIFISLLSDKSEFWENALTNHTLIYKYKRNIRKCIGVVVSKKGEYFDFNWAFIESESVFNQELENQVRMEEEFYGDGISIEIDRYRFK